MAVTVSVDTTHYSCVVPGPKTTALITILIARHFARCIFFFSFSGDGESVRIEKIGACLGRGGGLVPQ